MASFVPLIANAIKLQCMNELCSTLKFDVNVEGKSVDQTNFFIEKLTSFARRIVLYFLFLALATKQFTTNSAPNHRMLLIQMLSDIIFVCQVKYKNCYYHLLGAVNIFVSLFFCVYPPLNCFSMYFLRPFTGGRRVLFPSYIKIK